jgi:phosphoenolpyruvate-protein kinase (PTS system EI component)
MATGLMIAAMAATAASTGVSMYSQYQQGKFESEMANYQASLARSKADLAKQNAAIQSLRLSEKRRQATASGMSAFAANGLLIDDSGNSAPNLWEQDMAAETAWQQEELKTQAMYEAWGYESQASALVAKGKPRKAGRRSG